eukprot:CAMPEP_0114159776 /NCGR_PEP_ID=MMETSP0043_2-20121206/27970_1 /TAXON_ID=464988 /ORGANISM="Hemiselmis andersenii, Strain CCMP644" /LENGTH=91 /DNA_ID=CAMNT_0001255703 /DNA_START=208 /DNA_END=479 /DNA_ORIENTATION=-
MNRYQKSYWGLGSHHNLLTDAARATRSSRQPWEFLLEVLLGPSNSPRVLRRQLQEADKAPRSPVPVTMIQTACDETATQTVSPTKAPPQAA